MPPVPTSGTYSMLVYRVAVDGPSALGSSVRSHVKMDLKSAVLNCWNSDFNHKALAAGHPFFYLS